MTKPSGLYPLSDGGKWTGSGMYSDGLFLNHLYLNTKASKLKESALGWQC